MDVTLDLLKRLIAIDSVNPSLVPGAAGEAAIARMLVEYLRDRGFAVEVQDAAPGRPNVVATLEGRAPGRSLMFCGHIDTVGVIGMDAPFIPEERDGRIYGRGSQDMKGGVAAMIGAAEVIAQSGGLDAGRILIACVADEEHASIGADALVTKWRADGAVVTEPTDLTIGVAHKGFEWVEIETRGVAAHGSRPRDGRDAIMRMGRVLGELEALDRDLQSRAPHALLGTASLHASLISGGRELSSYPDRCTLQLERRTLPGERIGVAAQEVQDILARLMTRDDEFEAASTALFARAPFEVPQADALPATLVAAAKGLGLSAPVTGMSYWADTAVLQGAGIPSVLFGPAGAGLHGVDEYVDTRSVLQCRDALVALARAWGKGDGI
ncbi:MAG: ArgE/DapE family deacylase [Vicinamibacterales bacterium]|nr:ArgE/DapE family deacylase [Vicinamibacterales bacterium]